MTVVEDEFDFWSELAKDETDVLPDSMCLLSKEILSLNHIILPCGHKFNYIPLCREIANLKYPKSAYARTLNLNRAQTCCPYCRKIFDKLLPKIPLYDLTLPKYICSDVNSLAPKQCSYVLKCAKNKGTICEKTCGFDTIYGVLCVQHYKHTNKSADQFENEATKKIFNSNTIIMLKSQLKELNLSVSGNKRDLVSRLVKHTSSS